MQKTLERGATIAGDTPLKSFLDFLHGVTRSLALS